MNIDLIGRNVLITGGSRGIGLATAKAFIKLKANVIITATHTKGLTKAMNELKQDADTNVDGLVINLEELTNAKAFFEIIQEKFNHQSVDILVNNAGIGYEKNLDEINFNEIRQVFQVNLTAPLLLAQAFADQFQMKDDQNGSIINISSIASKFDIETNLVYGISKAGINKLTLGLAKNLGKKSIRVNAILPGSIDTDMTREKYSHPEIYQALIKRLPLSRRGTGEDIANLTTFLSSDAASYITGQQIAVDGGWLLQ